MVVDDSDDFRLLEPRYRLTQFIMIHQNDFFAAGTDQMIPGQGTDYFFFFIQNRIRTKTAFQHRIADIIKIIIQMKKHQVIRAGDSSDRNGLEKKPGSTICIQWGDNKACIAGMISIILSNIALAEDHARRTAGNRLIGNLAVITAKDNTSLMKRLMGTRQGDDNFAGDFGKNILILIKDMAFQRTEKITDRY